MRANDCIEIVGNLIQRREIVVQLESGQVITDASDINTLSLALNLWSDLIYLDLPSDIHLDDSGLRRFFATIQKQKMFQVTSFFRTLKSIEACMKRMPEILCTTKVNNVQAYFKHMLSCEGCNMHLASLFYLGKTYQDFADPYRLYWNVTLVTFLSRLQCSSADYTQENINEYVNFEKELTQRLSCSQYRDASQPVLSDLHNIMQEWLTGWTLGDYTFHHGPGSIAGFTRAQSDIRTKYREGRVSPTLRRLDRFLMTYGHTPMSGIFDTCVENYPHDAMSSEIVFVPKTFLTNRVISREDGYMMFFQQGLKDSLVRFMNRKLHWIDLTDQSRSRDLARIGSIDGEYATIDLSSASDSVSMYIVDEIFSETPLGTFLRILRTRTTRLPDGTKIPLEKFAPMGSALCFPVECLVFGAICELAIRRHTGHHSRVNDFVVYGDDIVVREAYASTVIELLNILGFRVNTLKSYVLPTLHNFREACGIECFDGKDISPCRISRRFSVPPIKESFSVSQVVGLVDFTNRLFAYGFFHMRRRMIEVFRSNGYLSKILWKDNSTNVNYPLALTTFDDGCTSYKLRSRWDRRLYLRKYHALVVTTDRIQNDTDDDVRYHEYWIRLFQTLQDQESEIWSPDLEASSFLNVIRPGTRLSWKWVWETR